MENLSNLKRGLAQWAQKPFAWLALAALLAMSYSWMSPQISAPNERTRLYLTLSVLHSGELAVNEQVAKYGTPFDIAKRNGKFYTDKAPGSSIIAVPFLALYEALGGSPSIERMTNFARGFVMIPIALLTLVFLRAVILEIGMDHGTANCTIVAFALGTSFFHYGAAFFGHAMVTCVSLLAALAILRSRSAEPPAKRRVWQLVVGLAGGIAFAIEYQAAIICIGIAAGYLSTRENWKVSNIALPMAGALIPIGLTFAYNEVAFGGALQTSYAHLYHSYSRRIHSHGLFGIQLPSWNALYGILISPSRGILLCAPLAALGWLGLANLWRCSRSLAIFAGTSMVGYLVVVGGFPLWYAGWGFGLRLLVPVFGLAAVAAASLIERVRTSPAASGLIAGYLCAGIAYNVVVTAMFPEIPHEVKTPLPTIAMPLMTSGQPSPNLGMTLLGLQGVASVVPLFIIAAALMAYVARTLVGPWGRWKSAAVPACLAVLAFGILTIGHPESYPAKKAVKFVEFASKLRLEPK